MKFLSLFTFVAFLFGSPASAIQLSKRFGIGLSGGFAIDTAGSNFRNAANAGYSVSVAYQYFFSDQWGVNVTFDRLKFGSNNNTLANSLTFGALYRFCGICRLTPNAGLALGFGATSQSIDARFNAGSCSVNARVGVDYALSDNWVLGLTAKYLIFFNEHSGAHDEHGFAPQIGITYYFGSDKNTGDQTESQAIALPGDRDHDGVTDDIDQCSATPQNKKVNSLGCPLEQKVELTINIEFDNGHSTVKPEYHDELKKMADLLKAHSDIGAEIQGHSDNVGDEAANLKLSKARASSVKNYLVNQLGAPNKSITSRGYGPTRPIADNATAAGRQKNRRVVAVLQSL